MGTAAAVAEGPANGRCSGGTALGDGVWHSERWLGGAEAAARTDSS